MENKKQLVLQPPDTLGDEVRVVEDPNSMPGWSLRAIAQKDETYPTSVCAPDGHGGFNSCPTTLILSRPVYIMTRPAVDTIAELKNTITEYQNKVSDLNRTLKTSSSNKEAMTIKIGEMEKQIETYRTRHSETNSEMLKLKQLVQRLEVHLGKVRDEIGASRWREIVGE
jgi:hypothetical protein